jgi:hypothetical protein
MAFVNQGQTSMNITHSVGSGQYGRASIWFNGKSVPIFLLPESDIDGLIEIRRGSSKLLVDVKTILAVEASTRSE